MEQEKYGALVARLEEYARANPFGYKMRVVGLALVGYAYIIGVSVALLVGAALVLIYARLNFLVIKIIWIPAALALVALRSLWVTLPEPNGRRIERRDAPELFNLIAELTRAVRSPKIHHVIIDGSFNAGVVQLPRLGFLGWSRNYLVIGAPLAHALTPAEFRAVLAHELGHLSGAHGRIAAWVYRIRQTWVQLLVNLHQQKRRGVSIFTSFFEWYAPYFSTYTFALARAHEYEADRSASQAAGGEMTAATLVKIELRGRMLDEEFFPELYANADDEAEPPSDMYERMYAKLRAPLDSFSVERWLDEALRRATDYHDTHPALSDRLKGIGIDNAALRDERLLAASSSATNETAADVYLRGALDGYTPSLNRLWKESVLAGWRDRNRQVRQARERVRLMEEKATGKETLTVEESWNLAKSVAEAKGVEAALPHLQQTLQFDASHAGAKFVYGQALLKRGDEACVEYFERAMKIEPQCAAAGCEMLYEFFAKRGRADEAAKYRARAAAHNERLELAQRERQTISEGDRFEPHGLDTEEIAGVREQLALYAQIKTAYLVRKSVAHFPGVCRILCK